MTDLADTSLSGRAPFSLRMTTHRSVAVELLAGLAEDVLGLSRLNDLYGRLRARTDDRPFTGKALAALDVSYVTHGAAERIPQTGSLIVVANHPFGGIDGLVLLDLLGRERGDIRILGNYMLARVPEMRESVLKVDPFGGAGARRLNVAAAREALRWVGGGGCLVVFPAGEVSHVRWKVGPVVDPAWGPAIGRLALRARCPVLPVYFDGRNSAAFQIAGLIHPRLRTAMLPREMLRRRRAPIALCLGAPVPPERLASLGGPQAASDYIRARTYVLQGRLRPATAARVSSAAAAAPDVAPPRARHLIEAEIAALPGERCLARSGPWSVYCARAGEIPETLLEIGRLRETTFRGAGEGTGKTTDLDRFDGTYHHLFLWNAEDGAIAGAYRIGATDEIVPREGVGGLYTSTLFRYRPGLLDQIGPALELGRSFVRAEYQRETTPLALLWKGIGAFVVSRPRYRRLFGPVSISNSYDSVSRHLLAAFLKMNRYAPALGRWIRPRHRYRPGTGRPEGFTGGTVVRDLDQVDDLIREIEADRKGMPVLLRHYLRLEAVLMGITLDPDFGDVLDGLMLVDLTRVPRPILARFMGRAGMDTFLRHHGLDT